MKKLKVHGNNNSQSIHLNGDPRDPEPCEVRITFPGGFVSICRCDKDGERPEWWMHMGVFHPDHPDKHRVENLDQHGNPGRTVKVIDARVDRFDMSAHQTCDLGDRLAQIMAIPNVDHIAVKVGEE